MGLDPKTTAIALLGASSFTQSEYLTDSKAFLAAKIRISNYFQKTVGISQENCLDLFDSNDNADNQDSLLNEFISAKVASGTQDLIIYYVGHGAFAPADNTFYLALRNTRDSNPTLSSMTIRALANTVLLSAKKIRTFIILDCCFAAAAGTGFMSGQIDASTMYLRDTFATKGVALLCASSKDLPALVIQNREITMFSESLNEALLSGDSSINNRHLSLRQIHNLTYSYIKKLNPGLEVKPEVLSPIQIEGDIADLPHFENFGYGDSRHDIIVLKREIEGEIISNNLIGLGSLFIDFIRNFDQTGKFNTESILLCSECNELADEKATLDRSEFRQRKKNVFINIMRIMEQVIIDNIKANV